jgi:hypothetical protein
VSALDEVRGELLALRTQAIREPGTLARCAACRYWCREDHDSCPNCGELTRRTRGALQRKARLRATAVLGLVGTAVTVALVLAMHADLVTALIIAGTVTVVTALVGFAGSLRLASGATPAQASLTARARELDRSIERAQRQLDRLEEARSDVAAALPASDAQRDDAEAMLERKRAIRMRELQMLSVQRWHIDFERWLNCVEPLIANVETISWEEASRRIGFVEEIRDIGRAFAAACRRKRSSDTEAGRRFLEQLEDVIANVGNLRQVLALRKAQLADAEASALDAEADPGALRLPAIRKMIESSRAKIASDVEEERLRLEAETEVQEALRA